MIIHKLRISRATAGKTFPFDLLYLVNYVDRAYIASLFDYSIVMPLKGETLKQLSKMPLGAVTEESHSRVDDNTKKLDRAVVGEQVDLRDTQWLAVVPILGKRCADTNAVLPNYLTADRWHMAGNVIDVLRAKKTRGKRLSAVLVNSLKGPGGTTPSSAFNDQAYLQTPGRCLRPPCLMCPRYILHTQNECSLGDPVCFSNLPLAVQAAATTTEEFQDE